MTNTSGGEVAENKDKAFGSVILKGAAAMTFFSLLNKLLGVFLRLFLSARIGSEGMGLQQLILSVYTMFATFATAGLTVSVSRLIAEKEEKNIKAAALLRSSFTVAFAVSVSACVSLFISADALAFRFIGDARCGNSLKILAFSMPFMSFSSCLKGWFIAKRKVIVTASASFFEETVKFGVIIAFLCVFLANVTDKIKLCEGIVWGITLSEACSFSYLLIFYLHTDKEKYKKPPHAERNSLLKELLSVASPISASVCLTGILHTAETLLIPYVFESYSGDRAKALSTLGAVRGMVIPLIFFPFAFLSSLISVFTPEISRLKAHGDKKELSAKIKALMDTVSLFGLAAGGIFFFQSDILGNAFYPGQNTGRIIKILATVTPFMYVETVADGVLKALGEQKRTLLYTVLNSVLRIILIFVAVKWYGENGYLLLLAVSNTFSYLLCRARIKKVAGAGIDKKFTAFSLAATLASGYASVLVGNILPKGLARFGAASAVTSVYLGVFLLGIMLFFRDKINILKRRHDG